MEAIPFTLPGSKEKTINIVDYTGAYFYTHLHRHLEHQLMWIMEGTGTLIVDHNIHSFEEGDIFLIGPNQPHVFKSDSSYFSPESKKTIQGLGVFFSTHDKLQAVFELPELKELNTFLNESIGGFKIPEKYQSKVAGMLLSFKETSGAAQISVLFQLLQQLYDIRKKLISLAPKTETIVYSEEKANRIQLIYDYVLQNYDDTIRLEEVAEKANFTAPAFCRYFKKHTGKTFIHFLNELRINEACKKLIAKNEDLQISEIAYKCGFNSVTNFNRVFKRITGESPSQYKKNYHRKLSRKQ